MKTTTFTCLSALAALAYGLVPAQSRAAAYHDNVVIVLDASASMNGRLAGTRVDKMSAAKTALKTVLQQIPETTHVGLLVFSGKNVPEPWVYPLGPMEPDALTQAIDRPQPDRGTPLGKFIKIGADRLLAERKQQFGYGSYRLLIVTDGEAQDQQLIDRYTPEVLARGLIVDVIGVGMKQDHTLATRVHSYRRADDPESLQRAVAEVLAEVVRPRTDAAEEEAFELLAPIPVEVAAAAVEALSTSGNEPIGSSQATRTPRPPRTGPPPASQPRPRPAPSRSPGMIFGVAGLGCGLLSIFFIVLVVTILIRLGKRR